MKRFLFLAFASVAFAAEAIVPSTPSKDTDGCYAISTAEELYGFANIVNASATHDECGKLVQDIWWNWESWSYANPWTPIPVFSGTFDGQNHTIENLYYSAHQFSNDSTSSVGLFAELRGVTSVDGSVVKPAVVKNLGIIGNLFGGAGCNGAIAGKAYAAEITNSYQRGNVESYGVAGGLVGCASSVKIEASHNDGYIQKIVAENSTDSVAAGGLVGRNDGDLSIVNSYNVGDAFGGYFGGLVGASQGKLNIFNSFSYFELGYTQNPLPLVGKYNQNDLLMDNVFYLLPEFGEKAELGTAAEKDDFRFGLILEWLRDYNKNGVDGSAWGQVFGVDMFPTLTGDVSVSSVGSYEKPATKLGVKTPKVADNCYQIGSAEELYGFALIANAVSYNGKYVCGKLTMDIVVNKNVLLKDTLNGDGKDFVPWIPIRRFAGDFDGAGHTVSGLFFNETIKRTLGSDGKYYYVGLFGSVLNPDPSREVKIENVGVEDSYFYGSGGVGAIVGLVHDSSHAVYIRNCHSSSYVLGFDIGLVGMHRGDSLTLELSYNDGIVDGSGAGLIGSVAGKTLVVNSYSAAKLVSTDGVGLLVDRVDWSYSQDYRLHVVNSYGIDVYANEKSLEPRPAIEFVDSRLAPEFVNVFSEKTKKQVEFTYRTADSAMFINAVSNVDVTLFSDGTVATLLHNYRGFGQDGLVWGQKVGFDNYPVFSGTVSTSVMLSDLKLVTFDGDTVKYFNKYKEGIVTALPKPVQKDYVFGGWFASADFSGEPINAIPSDATGPQTFYAKWIHYPLLVNGCYEIANASELYLFKEIADSLRTELCAKLIDDIVVNKNVIVKGELDTTRTDSLRVWIPLSDYNGVFDGNGHTISGLVGYSGFFGKIEKGNLVIKNLGIVDSYFSGVHEVGGFVGGMFGKSLVIANSYFDGIVMGRECIGGLIGYLDRVNTAVLSSYHRGSVKGQYDVGGLVGLSYECLGSLTMMYSYNEGSVEGIQAVGGLIGGEITDYLHLSNSYNVATVTTEKNGNGGLVGYLKNDSTFIYNSYNLGAVTAVGADSIGGICGFKKNYVDLHMDSAYYLKGLPAGLGGTAVEAEDFANKNLLKRLQSYKNHGLDGSAWTQADSDKYPVLNKKVSDKFIDSIMVAINVPRSSNSTESSSSVAMSSSSNAGIASSSSTSRNDVNSSSSTTVTSSSSVVKSSSSSQSVILSSSSREESSSSVSAKSSSSVKAKSSSSSVKKSSSSSAPKSSSSVKSKSSSSGQNSLIASRAVSPVIIRSENRRVEITGMHVGEGYALLDMQGRLLQRGTANGTTAMLRVAQPGRYVVQVSGQVQTVFVH